MAIYRDLGTLPPFNPDNDLEPAPEPVHKFRRQLTASDAILIASPEYAHGVPGALKNALDWVVGSGELIDKPIALISTSGRARYAWASLVEILTTMSARVIGEASIAIALQGRTLDAAGVAADVTLPAALTAAIDALARSARHGRA